MTNAYDWRKQLEQLNVRYETRERCCDEMVRQLTLGVPSVHRRLTLRRQWVLGPATLYIGLWRASYMLELTNSLPEKNVTCPINALTPKRWTAAHLAAEHGDMKIMKLLQSVPGIDFNIKNDDGSTPLHIAALNNRVGWSN
ncbi:hypothetical protein BDW02DRAFT_574015 [Decorospora gaudefroyi]|uniref:Uncharacterized protein n=1 Tax=Decorospora gaudefroyi TaxID=184978 RepID=A0A6A5K4J1_9PLEO|nr:hypothetical protein BDW02DRAFT_574015 [Decorospora gaudefroyi]